MMRGFVVTVGGLPPQPASSEYIYVVSIIDIASLCKVMLQLLSLGYAAPYVIGYMPTKWFVVVSYLTPSEIGFSSDNITPE